MTEALLRKTVAESYCVSDCIRKMGLYVNGTTTRHFRKLVAEHGIDISHFLSQAAASKRGQFGEIRRRYPLVEKKCPICDKPFIVRQGEPKEKTTCSYGCANTFYRTGRDNPNFKGEEAKRTYRQRAINKHGHECRICGWDKCVEIHHLDRNRQNNKLDNLIPLCPNHHVMIHNEKFRAELESQLSA